MFELKLKRSLLPLSFFVTLGLYSCSSTPPEEPEAPKEEVRPAARPRFEGRRSHIAPLPEFRNTSAPAPAPAVQAESKPLWTQVAHLDRDSTPFALIFAGLLWAVISLLSSFYRYQHQRDGFIARSLVAFLIAVPFTFYWVTASVIALGVLGVMMLTLAWATFAGWRRERRLRRLHSPASAVGTEGVSPGLVRDPRLNDREVDRETDRSAR
jgi:hypothetical protein